MVFLNVLLHPHHLHLNLLVVQLELFMEFFGVFQVLLILLESRTQLLKVERVLELLLPLEHFHVLLLQLGQFGLLLGLEDTYT